MDKFLIRPAKKARTDNTQPPSLCISWNCNSLRLRAERKELEAAIKKFLDLGMDALMLQETRIQPDDRPACEKALRAAGLKDWKMYWGMHPGKKRYSGTAVAVAPQCEPVRVLYQLTDLGLARDPQAYKGRGESGFEDPEQEGRVVVLEYDRCWVMNVYTPNVLQGQAPAQMGRTITGRPLVILGDLNVCHTPLDVSHPDFFANAMKPMTVGSADPGLQGQPGYTEEERERFGALLLRGCRMVDTYRRLHPTTTRLTWGWAANFESGRYKGKYMGLDYGLVSEQLWDAGLVKESQILGNDEASCFGSDHVPVLLRLDWTQLKPTDKVTDATDTKAGAAGTAGDPSSVAGASAEPVGDEKTEEQQQTAKQQQTEEQQPGQ